MLLDTALAPLLAVALTAPGWEPPRVIAAGAEPHAAVGLQDGALSLLTNGRAATRFTWAGGQLLPTPLPAALPTYPSTPWSANPRGDVLMVGERERRVQAVAADATGVRTGFRYVPRAGTTIEHVAAALGPDGTSVIAWTQERERYVDYLDVWYTVRPPGGTFTPVRALGVDDAADVAVAVRSDGVPEVAFDAEGGVFHAVLPEGRPQRLAPIELELQNLALVPGGVGRSRVLFLTSDEMTSALLGPDGQWALQRGLARKPWALGSPLAPLPDGGAMIGYGEGDGVVVRRAAPGAAFGPAERVADPDSPWSGYTFELAAGPRGDALLTWVEQRFDDELRFGYICGEACHQRVRSAYAPPDAPFGPAQRVSGLVDEPTGYVSQAVSGTGERLIAWQEERSGELRVVRGSDATPPTPEPPDGREPALRVTLARGALQRRTLRARVRCDEACGVRVNVLSTNDDEELDLSLPPVELAQAGTRDVAWKLSGGQRRALRRITRLGNVWLAASAVDGAGFRTELNLRVR